MFKKCSLMILIGSLSSFTSALETCGSLTVGAFACASSSQCNSGPVFFDRDSIYHSGWWRWNGPGTTIGGNWNFDLKIDGITAYNLQNDAGSSTQQWAMPINVTRGAINNQFLAVGNHSVVAKIAKTSGGSCSETINYSVEQTKIVGILDKIVATGVNASAEGAMCIKGLSTGRLMPNSKVEFYAGADFSSAKSLGASISNKNSSYLNINNECSNQTTVGFNHTISERQRADYCDQRLWSAVVNPDNSKSQIAGSGSYYVPCALRPFVDEHEVNKSYYPWAIGLRGTNFKPGTRVELYNANGSLWALGQAYAFNSSSRVSFQLPTNTLPSGCNANQACQIKVRLINPDGASSNSFTDVSVLLPTSKPYVSSHEVVPAYQPWAIGLVGTGFEPNTKVELYDSNGNFWALGKNYAFNNTGRVSFQLPTNVPPSGCNLISSCNIKVRVSNSPNAYAERTVTIPSAKPNISNFELVTTYAPWAIGLVGSGFEPDTKIEIYDVDGRFWSAGKDYAFNNSGRVSFQLSGNVPPSKCNLNTSCNIKVRVGNSRGITQGIYSEITVRLPSAMPVISESQLVTTYNPWAIGLRGSGFTSSATIEIMDVDGRFWGHGVGYAFNSSDRVSFQLPANIPPSRCNVGKTCTVKFKYTNSSGLFVERSVTLPKQ